MLPINITLLSVYFIGSIFDTSFWFFIRIDYLLKVTLYRHDFCIKFCGDLECFLMTKYNVDYYWKIFC